MKDSNFVWTDLSTFDLSATKAFYAKVFGWAFHEENGYAFGTIEDKQSAGIYTMPEKFQQMNLPSFWMSYISVTDIDTVVDKAKEMGGIIEIKPTDFLGQGQIALIRDPAGAGFTVWEGPDLGGKDDGSSAGRMIWNELIVSDASLVTDFYRAVFGWSFTPEQNYEGERYDICNGAGNSIAAMEVIPNELKGKEEFWVPYFMVKSLDNVLALIEGEGGEIVDRSASAAGDLAMAKDPQGAAFALIENVGAVNPIGYDTKSNGIGNGSAIASWFKPRTFLALVVIYIAVIFELQWVWGLLFLLWLIPDLRSGVTHLVEPIRRAEHPVWYWLSIGTWLWMALYLFWTIFT